MHTLRKLFLETFRRHLGHKLGNGDVVEHRQSLRRQAGDGSKLMPRFPNALAPVVGLHPRFELAGLGQHRSPYTPFSTKPAPTSVSIALS